MAGEEPLSILLTNIRMSAPGGAQTFTRDLAMGLLRAGCRPSVFTPRPGVVSEELIRAGVPCFDRLSMVSELPDVIHGNQHAELVGAIAHFRDVPALFTCHSPIDLCDTPPCLRRIRCFVAVDSVRRSRLLREPWMQRADVTVVFNSVDLSRLAPRSRPLPERPRRALLLSNYATVGNFGGKLLGACAAAGLDLEFAGIACGSVENDVAARLRTVDLVFAVGRSAIEAMACGVPCILCDRDGIGPMVSAENASELREYNFGRVLATEPISDAAIRTRLDQYDPRDTALLQRYIRREASVERMVAEYRGLYAKVLCDSRTLPNLADDFRMYAEYSGHVVTELMSRLKHSGEAESEPIDEARIAYSARA